MWFRHYLVKILPSPYEHSNSQQTMEHPVFKNKQSVVNFTWNQLLMSLKNKQVIVLVMTKTIVQVNVQINFVLYDSLVMSIFWIISFWRIPNLIFRIKQIQQSLNHQQQNQQRHRHRPPAPQKNLCKEMMNWNGYLLTYLFITAGMSAVAVCARPAWIMNRIQFPATAVVVSIIKLAVDLSIMETVQPKLSPLSYQEPIRVLYQWKKVIYFTPDCTLSLIPPQHLIYPNRSH